MHTWLYVTVTLWRFTDGYFMHLYIIPLQIPTPFLLVRDPNSLFMVGQSVKNLPGFQSLEINQLLKGLCMTSR